MSTATEQRVSRRRRHHEARASMLQAALELTRDAPFTDITVDEISRAAGVSRTAFYFYFRDKHELLLTAVEEVASELYAEADRWWHGEGEPAELVRTAVDGVTRVYAEHAPLLRLAVEASTYDQEVRDFWVAIVGRFIDATADHVLAEQRSGRIAPALDPRTTAEALCWMNERCLYIYLGRGERTPAEVTAALVPVWLAALYPGS